MKSDYGLSARSGATKRCISREEELLRQLYAWGDLNISLAEFDKKVKEIRGYTKKP